MHEDVREVMEVCGKGSLINRNRGDVKGYAYFYEACKTTRVAEELTR